MAKPVEFSPEALMAQWMDQHNESPTGKHWKGDIHRRYAQARQRHTCDRSCDKRSPLAVLKKSA